MSPCTWHSSESWSPRRSPMKALARGLGQSSGFMLLEVSAYSKEFSMATPHVDSWYRRMALKGSSMGKTPKQTKGSG